MRWRRRGLRLFDADLDIARTCRQGRRWKRLVDAQEESAGKSKSLPSGQTSPDARSPWLAPGCFFLSATGMPDLKSGRGFCLLPRNGWQSSLAAYWTSRATRHACLCTRRPERESHVHRCAPPCPTPRMRSRSNLSTNCRMAMLPYGDTVILSYSPWSLRWHPERPGQSMALGPLLDRLHE
jgi:hypothetical protein